MKLLLITKVWIGEYDPAEFTPDHTTAVDESAADHLLVTEVLEFDPERTEVRFLP